MKKKNRTTNCNRKLLKTISVILSLLMILTVVPIITYAEEPSADQNFNSGEVIAEQSTDIIGEIIEKREFDTKHFLMKDGSIVAAKYTIPVHYYDENGVLQDVDNSLSEELDAETGKNQLTNQKNTFDIKFSKKSNGNKLVTLKKDNHKVSWDLVGAKKVSAEYSDYSGDQTNDPMILQKLTSSVKYSDILKSVDIVYSVDASKVKENIVLKDENAPESFAFSYKLSGLNYRITEDGDIELYDKKTPDKTVFTIEKPYMYDANKAYSEDISMDVKEKSNGFEITLTPNKNWINSEERVYPIIIDPTAGSSTVRSDIWDIDMMQNQSQMFSCNAEDLVVGVDNLGRIFRSVIKFNNMPTIDMNSAIVNATLSVTAYPGIINDDDVAPRPRPSGNPIVNIHRVTASWPETTDWNTTADDYDSIIEDYFTYNTTDSYFLTDITKVVSGWYKGTYENYGIMLKSADETTANRAMQFTSSDWGCEDNDVHKSYRPVLIINYRNTLGLEDYWSYTTQDMGGYGTGYVNNYNGNLVYVHQDTSFNSIINGFALSHIYNMGATSGDTGRYGYGWRLNLVQTLEPVSVAGNSSVKYVYTDGDGTEHYFIQKSDNTITDEDGLGYTYTEITGGELTSQLTHKDGTVLKFDQWGYLRSIIDNNGNYITLNYSPGPTSDKNHLTSITTSSGGVFSLNYDQNYILTSIVDNASRTTRFNYSNGNLASITYPDGTNVGFEYYEAGIANGVAVRWLKNVVIPDGSKLEYAYYMENGKIHQVSQKGKNGTLGEALTFQYEYNQTYITDSDGYKLTYQFDTAGRPTGVYDSYDNIYNQTYTETVTNGSGMFKNNKLEKSTNGAVYVNNHLTNPVFSEDLAGWYLYDPLIMEAGVVNNVGLLSSKSVRIHRTLQQDSTCFVQNFTGKQGGIYTYSGYIKTENVVSPTGGAGLELVTSKNRFVYSTPLKGTTDIEVNNGFQFVSLTVYLEPDETINRVSAGLYVGSGTVWIDSVQLEEGEASNPINLLTNSSFEQNGNGSTHANGFANNANGYVTSAVSKDGSNSACINGNQSQDYNFAQAIVTNGNAGDVYSFGAYVKATAVPNTIVESKNLKLSVALSCTDGSVQWEHIEYNHILTDWQFTSNVIIAEKPYFAVTVYLCYFDNCNTAYFDNVFLYRDTMQSYRYDNNGNVISTTDYAQQSETFKFEGNNLSALISPDGSDYEYLYNSQNNVKSSRNSQGIAYDIRYNAQGSAVSADVISHPYSYTLSEGMTYYIRLGGSGKYLTVENFGTFNGANVIQAYFTGEDNQKWTLAATEDGGYTLHPAHYIGICLDITDYNDYELANVAINEINGSTAQTFYITPKSAYNYTISPKCSANGKILTVNFSHEQNNVTILTPQGDNNADQSWFFECTYPSPSTTISDGSVYMLRARSSGQYLTSGISDGRIVQSYMDMERPQKFIANNYQNSGYYTLSPFNDSNALAQVSTATSATNGSPYLEIGDTTITDRKLFKFEYDSSYKGFCIIPKYDETLTLTVPSFSTSPETELVFATKGSAINQCFVAEKINGIITSSATYQDNGNYPHTVTDSLGNTTTYGYDFSRGLQTSVTDAKNNTTSYQYNAQNDRLNSVTAAGKTVSYEYDTVGALKKITAPGGTAYNFNYDEFGRTTNISVGSRVLSATEYKDNKSSLISKLTYGNGAYREYNYDDLKRLTSESINGTITKKYLYDKKGNTVRTQDLLSNVITNFQYDLIGRLSGVKASNGHQLNYFYDEYNRLKKYKYTNNITDFYTEFTYGNNPMFIRNDGYVYYVSLNGEIKLSYNYDELGRLFSRTINSTTPFSTEYTYMDGATTGTTSTVIKTIKNGNDTLEYLYDDVGNIVSELKNGTVLANYTYDALNQLTIADVNGGPMYYYTYDNGGNITQVKEDNIVTKNYTYGDTEWKDLLTAYNGQTITYDNIGNPLTYRDGYTFTWSGRQLTSVSKNGELIATYTYDADGNRTSKTVNGVTTKYYWLNGVLQSEYEDGIYYVYLYDETGRPYGYAIDFLGIVGVCYYVYNQQGDIIAIRDETGGLMAEYSYGPYGETITTPLMDESFFYAYIKNPLRYRGYYYDAETGFYFCNSRYYDPETCRWINADGYVSTGAGLLGSNMFAYCNNNPITLSDSSGTRPILSSSTSSETAAERKAACEYMNRTIQLKYVNNNPVMPIPTSNFKNDYPYYASGDEHGGRDIEAPEETPIHSAFYGVVVKPQSDESYGINIVIESVIDGKRYRTIYAHLSDKQSIKWDVGDEINKGDIIGYVGMTGKTYGPHLHFEVRMEPYRSSTDRVDPKSFF